MDFLIATKLTHLPLLDQGKLVYLEEGCWGDMVYGTIPKEWEQFHPYILNMVYCGIGEGIACSRIWWAGLFFSLCLLVMKSCSILKFHDF